MTNSVLKVVAATLLLAILSLRPASAGTPSAGRTLLDGKSHWRTHFTLKKPMVRQGGKLVPIKIRLAGADTALPPANCLQPEFDDAGWPTWQPTAGRRRGAEYGYICSKAPGPFLRVMCLRGRFQVANPAAAGAMKLSLAYRGGAVVFLNGKEIARGNLPAATGAISYDFAEDYPADAFVTDKGRPIRWGFGENGKFKAGLAKRVRRLDNVTIPSSALRKGSNVLVVVLHGTAYYKNDAASGFRDRHYSTWGSCGLVELELRGGATAQPRTSATTGLQVWNHPMARRIDTADRPIPNEPLRPLRMAGARNGSFSAQVVLSSPAKLSGFKAAVTDLKAAAGGGSIPASAVQVRYAIPEITRSSRKTAVIRYHGLDTVAPANIEPRPGRKGARPAALQPLWVTIRVPRNAKPGQYRGTLSVSAAGAKDVKVPIELSVADWTIPDAKNFVGFLDVIQSPQSVALHYKVKPWSEEHWKLVEKSFQAMGTVGAKVVYITVLPRTYFGNGHGMVRWIKGKGGTYKHDFSVAERYLDLAVKYLGKPPVVCVYLWDRRAGTINYDGKDYGKGKGTPFTLLDPATGKLTEAEGPRWGAPEARKFWKPVIEGLRQRLAKRGLEKSMMWGLASDRRPRPETVKDLKAMAPGVKWICHSHPKTEKVHGHPVGYIAHVWGATQLRYVVPPKGRGHGWKRPTLLTTFPRMSSGGVSTLCAQPVQKFRFAIEAVVASGYRGLGRVGGDFWRVTPDKRGRKIRVLRTDPEVGQTWGIGLECAVEETIAAGRKGPVSSSRMECFRENLQEIEARAFIEKALTEPARKARLGAKLAERCQRLLDERTWDMLAAVQSPKFLYWLQGETTRSRKLYAAAADVAARLGK
jgi:Glycoside hydrolase 123, catalytic domain/Glycoside hydrolase 123 N-terminal domain